MPEVGAAYVSKPKDGASPVEGALELPDFTGLAEHHSLDGIELPSIGDSGAGHMAAYFGERISLTMPVGVYRKMGDGTWRHIVCDAYLTDRTGGSSLQSIKMVRDTTLYIRWRYADSDGVASTKK